MIPRASFVLVLGLCSSLAAFGQEEALDGGESPRTESVPDEAGLEGLLSETVGSSASKSAESESDAPATTWSISGTDLKRYGIQSIEEAIRFLGHAMTSYEYDARHDTAFGARGYNSDNLGQNIAVLIDGNQGGGSAKTARGTQPYLIPIELVDHIELVIGPGSVIYGNSAMLGVINVVTRKGSSLDGTPRRRPGQRRHARRSLGRRISPGARCGRAPRPTAASRPSLGSDPFELAWHLGARWNRQEGRTIWHRTGDPYADPNVWTPEPVFNRDVETKLFGRATWGHWTFMGWVGVASQTGIGPIETGAASSTFEPEYVLDATYAKHISDRGDLSWRFYGVVFDSYAKLVPYQIDAAHCQAKVGVSNCYDTLHYVNFRPFVEPMFTWDWNADGSHVTTLGGQMFVDGSVITQGVGLRRREDRPRRAADRRAAPQHRRLRAAHLARPLRHPELRRARRPGHHRPAVSPRIAYSKGVWEGGTIKALVSTGFRNPSITERFLEDRGLPHRQPQHQAGDRAVRRGEPRPASRQPEPAGVGLRHLVERHHLHRHHAPADGTAINQFTNLRDIISAGVNVGWRGATGPVDWALSANYAPGRVKLPGDVASYSDQQLSDIRLYRQAVDRYGQSMFGSVLLPVGGMPDFYATGHVSYGFGEVLPRLSVAATINSPRLQVGVEYDQFEARSTPRRRADDSVVRQMCAARWRCPSPRRSACGWSARGGTRWCPRPCAWATGTRRCPDGRIGAVVEPGGAGVADGGSERAAVSTTRALIAARPARRRRRVRRRVARRAPGAAPVEDVDLHRGLRRRRGERGEGDHRLPRPGRLAVARRPGALRRHREDREDRRAQGGAEARALRPEEVRGACSRRRSRTSCYLAPELDEQSVDGIVDALGKMPAVSITGVSDNVKRGVILGFSLVEARPRVFLNLKQAAKQNVAFHGGLVSHSVVVDR